LIVGETKFKRPKKIVTPKKLGKIKKSEIGKARSVENWLEN